PPRSTLFPYTTLFRSISDLLSVIKALDIRDYWTKPDLNFLLYTFIKFSVCILTAEKTREYCNTHEEATGETCKYFDKQRQLAMRSEEHTSELQSRENL